MPGSALCKTVATIPGFNWFLIDAEHGQITDKDYYDVSLWSRRSSLRPILWS